MKKFISVLIIIAVIFLTFICVFSLLSTDNKENDKSSSDTIVSTESNDKENQKQKVYEDDYIKVSFVELFEEKSVKGASYLKLLIENKSDKDIMISLKDISVNNMMVNSGSGMPMVITPNSSSQQPFVLFTGAAGINSSNEINEILFKVMVLDNNTTKTLEETKQLKISIK